MKIILEGKEAVDYLDVLDGTDFDFKPEPKEVEE